MAKSAAAHLLLGVHISIAGGVAMAPERAKESGCNAIQIFTQSPNQWRAKPLDPEDGVRLREGLAAAGVSSVIAHDIYLINLASRRTSTGRSRSPRLPTS